MCGQLMDSPLASVMEVHSVEAAGPHHTLHLYISTEEHHYTFVSDDFPLELLLGSPANYPFPFPQEETVVNKLIKKLETPAISPLSTAGEEPFCILQCRPSRVCSMSL